MVAGTVDEGSFRIGPGGPAMDDFVGRKVVAGGIA
jgi:hypothetical protein